MRTWKLSLIMSDTLDEIEVRGVLGMDDTEPITDKLLEDAIDIILENADINDFTYEDVDWNEVNGQLMIYLFKEVITKQLYAYPEDIRDYHDLKDWEEITPGHLCKYHEHMSNTFSISSCSVTITPCDNDIEDL